MEGRGDKEAWPPRAYLPILNFSVSLAYCLMESRNDLWICSVWF